jgi:tetraacyldisaccharide 4'-kinase
LAYRSGVNKAQRLPVPVIAIGNVTVGGTGKTPLTLWLAQRLLAHGWHPAILSRGHGVRIEGTPRRVAMMSLAEQVGDEPLMLKHALPEIEVVVHPERFLAGQLAIELGADVLLLDDGLQHLQLARDIEIALVDGARGLGNARCLPAGPLREPALRLAEVDAVVLLGEKTTFESPSQVRTYSMRLSPRDAVNLVDGTRRPFMDFVGQDCDALAGIGHPERFFTMLRDLGLTITPQAFSDHHAFSAADLHSLQTRPLLMTAKDAVKCRPLAQTHQWHNQWVVPVEAALDADFEAFIFSRLGQDAPAQTKT